MGFDDSGPRRNCMHRAGIQLEVFDGRDGSQLLYAAQVALSVLKQKDTKHAHPHPLADVDRPVTRADESAASAAHWLANPITEAEKLPTLAQRWAAEPEWDGPDPTGDDSPA
jgi:hypothetical protein